MTIKYYKLMDMLNKKDLGKEQFRSMANISSVTMAKIAKGESVRTDTINKICRTLDCQPGDIMEYIPDRDKKEEK